MFIDLKKKTRDRKMLFAFFLEHFLFWFYQCSEKIFESILRLHII